MKTISLKKIMFLIFVTSVSLTVISNQTQAQVSLSKNELKKLQYSANKDKNPISQYLFAKELLAVKMEEKGLRMMMMSALNTKADQGNGYEKAQRDIAEYYMSKKEYSKAIPWFKKSATTGNMKSSYVLSTMYRLGLGTKKDFNMSLAWMKYSAKKGGSEALRALGQMHLIGFGTAKDEDKGIMYLEKAIKKNNYQAMLTLGVHYKVTKVENAEANRLITKVKQEKTSFMADYIYKTNVSGESVDMKLIGGTDKRNTKKKTRGGSDSVRITNRSNLMDEKVMQYYKHLLYNFRTLEQSLYI